MVFPRNPITLVFGEPFLGNVLIGEQLLGVSLCVSDAEVRSSIDSPHWLARDRVGLQGFSHGMVCLKTLPPSSVIEDDLVEISRHSVNRCSRGNHSRDLSRSNC
jgi:hypothetical protein